MVSDHSEGQPVTQKRGSVYIALLTHCHGQAGGVNIKFKFKLVPKIMINNMPIYFAVRRHVCCKCVNIFRACVN